MRLDAQARLPSDALRADRAADLAARLSRVADRLAEDDAHALALCRRAVAARGGPARRLPWGEAPARDPEETLGVVPADLRTPCDVREAIARIADGSRLDECKARHGGAFVAGFAAIMGIDAGLVASNGVLLSEAALKGAHVVEPSSQRRVPLVVLQDVTGFMVGRRHEAEGIAEAGAETATAVAVAAIAVPKVAVLIGASHGAGNDGMARRAYDPRVLRAWTTSRIAVMGGGQAAGVPAGAPRGRRAAGRRPVPGAGGPVHPADPRGVRAPEPPPLRRPAPLGRRDRAPPPHARGPGPVAPRRPERAHRRDALRRVQDVRIARLLVADRGEVACRVIDTCRRLGVETVAVLSHADAGARHVALADRAVRLGPPPAAESCLRGDLILAAARRGGRRRRPPRLRPPVRDPDVAEAAQAAGLAWVGPSPDAIRATGLKGAAKAPMERAGVPAVPGYHGEGQPDARLAGGPAPPSAATACRSSGRSRAPATSRCRRSATAAAPSTSSGATARSGVATDRSSRRPRRRA